LLITNILQNKAFLTEIVNQFIPIIPSKRGNTSSNIAIDNQIGNYDRIPRNLVDSRNLCKESLSLRSSQGKRNSTASIWNQIQLQNCAKNHAKTEASMPCEEKTSKLDQWRK
jgi:hypothetical protein